MNRAVRATAATRTARTARAPNTYSHGRKRGTVRMRKQGRTDIDVSTYGLGTMMSGRVDNPGHDDRVRVIRRALGAGINTIDTADVHGSSETETLDVAHTPPSPERSELRRRPHHERAAA